MLPPSTLFTVRLPQTPGQLHQNRAVLCTAAAAEPPRAWHLLARHTHDRKRVTSAPPRRREGGSAPRAWPGDFWGLRDLPSGTPATHTLGPSPPHFDSRTVRVRRTRRLTLAPFLFSSWGEKCALGAGDAWTRRPSPLGGSRTLLPERRRYSRTGECFSALGNKPSSDWRSGRWSRESGGRGQACGRPTRWLRPWWEGLPPEVLPPRRGNLL